MQCERDQCALNRIECALPRSGFKPVRMRFDFWCSVNTPLRTSTLRLRMSRDYHTRAVLLVKNSSSTMDNRDASLPSMVSRRDAVLLVLLWDFLRLRRTHRALRVSKESKVLA